MSGLCTEIRTDGLLLMPLGTSSPTGSVASATFVAAYTPALVGVDLFLQALARDLSQPGLPFVLTQGVQIPVPADPPLPDVAHAYSYRTPVGSDFSTIEHGGIVARFTQ